LARSYIKIYGPPLLKAIRALEKVAVEFSQKTTIRVYDILTPTPMAPYIDIGTRQLRERQLPDEYRDFLLPEVEMPVEEKVKLISRASDTLGDHDFFFEWGKEPTKQEVVDLIEKIDEALADCGCRYTITTK
jgi:hypothetical protein